MVVQRIHAFPDQTGGPYEPLDFTLGLPAVGDWLLQEGDPPWILDPAEHPKPDWPSCLEQANHPPPEGTELGSTDDGKRRRRKKKKHHRAKKPELKVTTWGVGDDNPIWSHTGSATSSSSSSQSKDSGLGSYKKQQWEVGSTTRPDYTPGTVQPLLPG